MQNSQIWEIFPLMETSLLPDESIDARIAQRLKALRLERQWSLDDLARASGVSRASLSRLENAEVSPTASVLGKLCAAFGLTMSRLMVMVEEGFAAHVRAGEQFLWEDPETGYVRRVVSPPAQGLSGEVLDCTLKPATRIAYETPPKPGLEHHLVLMEGALSLTVSGQRYDLKPGDCLRYRLHGASLFETGTEGAHYFLFLL